MSSMVTLLFWSQLGRTTSKTPQFQLQQKDLKVTSLISKEIINVALLEIMGVPIDTKSCEAAMMKKQRSTGWLPFGIFLVVEIVAASVTASDSLFPLYLILIMESLELRKPWIVWTFLMTKIMKGKEPNLACCCENYTFWRLAQHHRSWNNCWCTVSVQMRKYQ